MATDYSGNGFHAQALTSQGGDLPTFSGHAVKLDAAHWQYLRIDPGFGPVLKGLDSFSVTATAKFKTVRDCNTKSCNLRQDS